MRLAGLGGNIRDRVNAGSIEPMVDSHLPPPIAIPNSKTTDKPDSRARPNSGMG